MSWTEDQLDRLRTKAAEARRNGAWLSGLELGVVLGLIAWWRRATVRSGFFGPSQGLPPTIADMRAHGVTHIFLSCAASGCNSGRRRVALNELHMPPNRRPLPDNATFLDIPNLCRFRCLKCGSRRVTIMADWPDAGHGAEERQRLLENPRIR